MKKGEKDKRATPAEIEQRITAILPYVILGKTGEEILEIIRQDPSVEWGVERAQLYNYIKVVKEHIKKSCLIDRNFEIGRVKHRLEELFKMAVKEKDINQARLLLGDHCKLFGLNAPDKIAPTDPTGEHEYIGEANRERISLFLALFKEYKENRDSE